MEEARERFHLALHVIDRRWRQLINAEAALADRAEHRALDKSPTPSHRPDP